VNILSRDQHIHIISCLTEGMSIRATERLTGVHRDTIMRLGARVGAGCARVHDKLVVGVRTGRLELDELWTYVGKKQRRMTPQDGPEKGDQWTYVALASSSRAIVSYWTGKRNGDNTDEFIADLRERVIGNPEISSDGYLPYQTAIRAAFRASAYGQITKTYSVSHIGKNASSRYSPAEVIAVSLDVVAGTPEHISTSYVERSHLTLRMSNKRFARLGNGFSKKLENHAASISLYVAHYNLCRPHESLRMTPAMALGITDRVWSIGDLLDAALAGEMPSKALPSPDRPKGLRVIEGGRR
jgi:IS1 family transposase